MNTTTDPDLFTILLAVRQTMADLETIALTTDQYEAHRGPDQPSVATITDTMSWQHTLDRAATLDEAAVACRETIAADGPLLASDCDHDWTHPHNLSIIDRFRPAKASPFTVHKPTVLYVEGVHPVPAVVATLLEYRRPDADIRTLHEAITPHIHDAEAQAAVNDLLKEVCDADHIREPSRTYTEAELRAAVRRVAAECDDPLTRATYDRLRRDDEPAPGTIHDRIGWRDALEHACAHLVAPESVADDPDRPLGVANSQLELAEVASADETTNDAAGDADDGDVDPA